MTNAPKPIPTYLLVLVALLQNVYAFAIGSWKTHERRRERCLTGSATWIEYEGHSVVRTVWNGWASLAWNFSIKNHSTAGGSSQAGPGPTSLRIGAALSSHFPTMAGKHGKSTGWISTHG